MKPIQNQKNYQKLVQTNLPKNSIIPLHIYQTWHDKTCLPESIEFCIHDIIEKNPQFTHHLYDTNECRDFIQSNFPSIVVDTYDVLIPHALKADLWRYCILYVNGGIYLDVKYSCMNHFNFLYLTDKEYFCKDLDKSQGGVYNAILVCKPKNEMLLNAIYKIVDHAKKQYYGSHSLCPTGPLLLKRFFNTDEIESFSLKLCSNMNSEIFFITFMDTPVLLFHKNYRKDQSKTDKHWSYYWATRRIYDTKLPQYQRVTEYKESMESIFTNLYHTCQWGNNRNTNYHGSSGQGSTLQLNQHTYVPFLKEFILSKKISTVVDLGCGDFICGPFIYNDLDIIYHGYDAYKKLIEYNQSVYSRYTFTHLDFYHKKEEIIEGDLCILKDVLMHWTHDEIADFLDYLIEHKKFKYILICNCSHKFDQNKNIITGEWRPLSCMLDPLKKYNPEIVYTYHTKEVSVITL